LTAPSNCDVTLAVKVTDCPAFDGFSEETTVVMVVVLLTSCCTGFEVLSAKVESPPYTALTAVVPGGSDEVVMAAVPLLKVAVPKTATPFVKVMVSPFGGAPWLEVTVAVKITA
jgi:hypothetical protein